jgi:hypothetical protein
MPRLVVTLSDSPAHPLICKPLARSFPSALSPVPHRRASKRKAPEAPSQQGPRATSQQPPRSVAAAVATATKAPNSPDESEGGSDGWGAPSDSEDCSMDCRATEVIKLRKQAMEQRRLQRSQAQPAATGKMRPPAVAGTMQQQRRWQHQVWGRQAAASEGTMGPASEHAAVRGGPGSAAAVAAASAPGGGGGRLARMTMR